MSKDVKTETSDQNIQAVCKIMHENNIGSVVIVNPENDFNSDNKKNNNAHKPAGIITERDIVRTIGKLEPSLLTTPLHELMSKPLITITSNGSINDAIKTMQLKDIRRLVVVEKQEMVGIITDKDILRAIIKNQSLIPTILNDELLMQNRPMFEQFREYWFSDILQRH